MHIESVGVRSAYPRQTTPTRGITRGRLAGGMPIDLVVLQLDVNLRQLGVEFGTGAVIGALIGFAAKKVAKLVAVIVGLELVVFKLLESRGILTVDWDRLGAAFLGAGEAATAQQPPSWFMSILSTLSIGAGFTGGFLLGFKKG